MSACLPQSSVFDFQYVASITNLLQPLQTLLDSISAAHDLPSNACLQVQVDKDRKLIISGERKKEETQTDVKWRQKRTERRFGAFQRKFQLPEDADVTKIKGKAENGVLSITISKVPMEDVPSDSTSIPIY